MKILIPLGDPFKISNYSTGSSNLHWEETKWSTIKQFERAAKKLEKQIEERKKDE